MSEQLPGGLPVSEPGSLPVSGQGGALLPDFSTGGRRRRRVVVAAALAVVVAAGVVLAATHPFKAAAPPSSFDNSAATALQAIVEEPISSQTDVDATLGYADTYDVDIPSGAPSTEVTSDQQTVQSAETKVSDDERSLADAKSLETSQSAATLLDAQGVVSTDETTLSEARGQLVADEHLDCPAATSATVTTAIGSGADSPDSDSDSPGSDSGNPSSDSGDSNPGGATGTQSPGHTDPGDSSAPSEDELVLLPSGTHRRNDSSSSRRPGAGAGELEGATGNGPTGEGNQSPSTVAPSTSPSTSAPTSSVAGTTGTTSPGTTGSSEPGTTGSSEPGAAGAATTTTTPASSGVTGTSSPRVSSTTTPTGGTGTGSPHSSGTPSTSSPSTNGNSPGSSGNISPTTSTPAAAGNPAQPSTTTTTIAAPTAPLVTLSAASVSSSTGATLSGTVDPDGAATTYRFEYGVTSLDGSYTASTTLQAGTTAEEVSAEVAHLRPDTTYQFVLIATNALGTTVSPPQTFDTMESSCAAERVVIASDEEAVSAAEDSLTADQATAGSTVTSDEQQLASDQQQLSADQQALTLAEDEVTNPGAHFTALPTVGEKITRGERVYSLDGDAVPLLYGSTTPYRALYLGVSAGPDVTELQRNLIALGFGSGLDANGVFGTSTELAVKAWQASLGVPVTGVVSLGSIVVEPGAIRVETVPVTLGESANAATEVVTASSTVRQVTIDLDAAQQSEISVGDQVVITLPDNSTTPGVVSYVGSVATAPTGQGGQGSTGNPTITVYVTPTDPSATGGLDQAPVEVAITTQSVQNALVVPVDALLALSSGGYAVEEVTHGVHHLVAVSLGIFDDADGTVQVTGAGLAAGQQVVVPAL